MIVVITGATKGIGRAIAEKFAADGNNMVVCARTEGDLQEMKSEFEHKYAGEFNYYRADVGKGNRGQSIW